MPPIFFHLVHTLQIIVEAKLGFLELLLHTSGFLFVDIGLSFLNETHHIAHSKDSRSHSVGIKLFQIGKLFTHTHIEDRFSAGGLNGKGCTASGIAVKLCQDDSVNANLLIEGICHIHSVLSGHGIYDSIV